MSNLQKPLAYPKGFSDGPEPVLTQALQLSLKFGAIALLASLGRASYLKLSGVAPLKHYTVPTIAYTATYVFSNHLISNARQKEDATTRFWSGSLSGFLAGALFFGSMPHSFVFGTVSGTCCAVQRVFESNNLKDSFISPNAFNRAIQEYNQEAEPTLPAWKYIIAKSRADGKIPESFGQSDDRSSDLY